MSVELKWLNYRQTVLHIVMSADMKVPELMEKVDEIAEVVCHGDRVIHQIYDMSALVHPPRGLVSALPKIAYHQALSHKNCGQVTVIVGQNGNQQVAHIFSNVFRQVNIVDSMDSALDLIQPAA